MEKSLSVFFLLMPSEVTHGHNKSEKKLLLLFLQPHKKNTTSTTKRPPGWALYKGEEEEERKETGLSKWPQHIYLYVLYMCCSNLHPVGNSCEEIIHETNSFLPLAWEITCGDKKVQEFRLSHKEIHAILTNEEWSNDSTLSALVVRDKINKNFVSKVQFFGCFLLYFTHKMVQVI